MPDLSTRPLGDSGLEVSVVGLGCNNFGRRVDLDGTLGVVDAALAAGVRFCDTADIYGTGQSEEFLGQVLEGRREEVVLATKFGMDIGNGKGPRGSRDYIRQAVEASLRRLRTDLIDFYRYHQPDGVTRSQRRWRLSTSSSGPARCARSARRISAASRSRRRTRSRVSAT